MRRGILATLLALVACVIAAPASAQAAPYSSHAQLYACCTPLEAKEAMFREAKESGAAYIRVDFEMHGIFPNGVSAPRREWGGPDQVAALSSRFGLAVVAILHGVPHADSSCPGQPSGGWSICPPVNPARWGVAAGQVAARYAGTINHFEVWNEPDGAWAFNGQPEDYARMLAGAYDGIKAAAPPTQVVLGGAMHPGASGEAWLQRAFETPGADAARKFDIANVHLRGDAGFMRTDLAARRAFVARWGRSVPMWVTEHGYPSDPAYQTVVRRASGEQAQADYLAFTLPYLALNGADQVFVTLRDAMWGEFASEGILAGAGPPSEPFRRKLAWQVVRDATLNWPAVLEAARRPVPVAFATGFLRTRTTAKPLKAARRTSRSRATTSVMKRHDSRWRRFRVTVGGTFAGRGCQGRVRITFVVPGTRRSVRQAPVGRDCKYRLRADLRVPARIRLPRRMRVDQAFLGSATTAPGSGPRLKLKLPRERRSR